MPPLRSACSTLALVLFVLAHSAYAETFEGAVVRVVDGDSLIVLRGNQEIRVRLKEIDAPERNQRFGKRSRQSLSDMCAKKTARVSWTEKDRNGRTLGRVWSAALTPTPSKYAEGWLGRLTATLKTRACTDSRMLRDPLG
jgi:endonuclease YncB( thermonuclease family)